MPSDEEVGRKARKCEHEAEEHRLAPPQVEVAIEHHRDDARAWRVAASCCEVDEEKAEELVVHEADAVVDPRAVMIHLHDAAAAD